MLVVAIISVLASISLPKFAQLVRKAREASTLGKLGSIRSATSIYYADNEGIYPHNHYDLVGKYIEEFPVLWTHEHGVSDYVFP